MLVTGSSALKKYINEVVAKFYSNQFSLWSTNYHKNFSFMNVKDHKLINDILPTRLRPNLRGC